MTASFLDDVLVPKKEHIVIVFPDLHTKNGRVNETRNFVDSMTHNLLFFQVASVNSKDKRNLILHGICNSEDDHICVLELIRSQFSVCVCFEKQPNKRSVSRAVEHL